MITMTDTAAKKVSELRLEKASRMGLAHSHRGRRLLRMSYELGWEDQQQADDNVVEGRAVASRSTSNKNSARDLTGSEIGLRAERHDGARFAVKNPTSKSSCGCGQSTASKQHVRVRVRLFARYREATGHERLTWTSPRAGPSRDGLEGDSWPAIRSRALPPLHPLRGRSRLSRARSSSGSRRRALPVPPVKWWQCEPKRWPPLRRVYERSGQCEPKRCLR